MSEELEKLRHKQYVAERKLTAAKQMCGNPASADGRRRKNEQPFADHR